MWIFGKKNKPKPITEKAVSHALMQIGHPQLGGDVVALGLVKNLSINSDKVTFTLVLPAGDTSYAGELERRCREAVQQVGAKKVTIKRQKAAAPRPKPNSQSDLDGVGHLLAVASGKGGVGKSTICFNLALALARNGYRVGLLDCDIYGPSIPALTGIRHPPDQTPDQRFQPHRIQGIQLMSMGFLVEDGRALIWRGPMTHKMIEQFLHRVAWGNLDYLLLDLPPGTGDVQLSLTQLTRISGALVVTTPQELALTDARKAVEMFKSVNVPVLGFVENMAWYERNGKRYQPFRRAAGQPIHKEFDKDLLAELPIDQTLTTPLETQPSQAVLGTLDQLAEKTIAAIQDQSPINKPAVATAAAQDWARPGPGAFEV